MDYPSLLKTVFGHLDELGIPYQAASGEPATDEALASAEAAMKIRLPAELREFYQTVGDEFLLFWESDSDDPKKPWGSLSVPSLSSLVDTYTGWRGLVLYSPERAEEYGFPHTNAPALAKRTAARMWHWLPVITEENGDAICLDLGALGCPVVFDRHSWMDGGSGDNGHPLAANWREFLIGWGSICFQMPKDLYWPWCFQPGGVAWDGEYFDSRFRVAELAKLHNT